MFLKMFSDKDESAVAKDLYTLGGQNHISHADRDRKEIKKIHAVAMHHTIFTLPAFLDVSII